jgi:hypothetical protein
MRRRGPSSVQKRPVVDITGSDKSFPQISRMLAFSHLNMIRATTRSLLMLASKNVVTNSCDASFEIVVGLAKSA